MGGIEKALFRIRFDKVTMTKFNDSIVCPLMFQQDRINFFHLRMCFFPGN